MEDNKRKHMRFSFAEPVGFHQLGVGNNGSLGGNISMGGIAIKAYEFMPVGTILELELQLTNPARFVRAQGKVVRIRESVAEDCYEMGIEFIRNEQCARAIGEYIYHRPDYQWRRS